MIRKGGKTDWNVLHFTNIFQEVTLIMLYLLVILLIVVVVFAVQNAQLVSISFLGWSTSVNLALVVLLALCIGLVVGALWSWIKGSKSRGEVKDLKKEIESLGVKIGNLEKQLQAEMEKSQRLIAQGQRSEPDKKENEIK